MHLAAFCFFSTDLLQIVSQGTTVSSFSVSFFEDRNWCGPATPKASTVLAEGSLLSELPVPSPLEICAGGRKQMERFKQLPKGSTVEKLGGS